MISPSRKFTRRAIEAWDRGATEVCLQGGIHPDYTGATYEAICRAIKAVVPDMHIHAFSALEVTQGAATLGLPIHEFLAKLKAAGLGTLPGTAAEILDDEVRAIICPDKINTAQWLDVQRAAHQAGLRTTSTIMYGHVETSHSWAKHLLALRDLQAETGGFTEFVPLPFVHMEAPMYRHGMARPGPTFREAVLMHSVARLALHPLIPNIQTSWVKMGPAGAAICLKSGANDLGGTLMNESISRAAGTQHGQEFPPHEMEALIRSIGREPMQRDTLYRPVPEERRAASMIAADLEPIVLTPPRKKAAVALSDAPLGQQRGHAKFVEQRAGARAGRLRQAQEKREIDRMVDIHRDSGLTDHSRLDALTARGVEMREIAVVAEAKRHRFRRRADHGIGSEIVMRRRDGERGRSEMRR